MVEIENGDGDNNEDKQSSRWARIRRSVENLAAEMGFGDVELPDGDDE